MVYSERNCTVNNIGRKDAFANHIRIDSKGIPYVSGIDDNYTFTDPQDALGGIPAKLVEITNKSPFGNREIVLTHIKILMVHQCQ